MFALDLKKIPGFETTDYAYLHGKIVWAGEKKSTDHPRNAYTTWLPDTTAFDEAKLRKGAQFCLNLFEEGQALEHSVKGLLLWLIDKNIPFPLNLSVARFDDVKQAFLSADLDAFTAAALRVIGLGQGLTPSGDDFLGGMMFALVHIPRRDWEENLPEAINSIHKAAKKSTNVISAALLDDLMAGKSYRALHEMLVALQSTEIPTIKAACERLLKVGASSGADMLAGLLLVLAAENPKLDSLRH